MTEPERFVHDAKRGARRTGWGLIALAVILGILLVTLWVVLARQNDLRRDVSSARLDTQALAVDLAAQRAQFTYCTKPRNARDPLCAEPVAESPAQVIEGPPGLQGLPGLDGLNGTDGRNGRDGSQGPRGLQGAVGRPGPPGPPGESVTGPPGPPGPPGTDGTDGQDGTDGTNGQDGRPGPTCPDGWHAEQRTIPTDRDPSGETVIVCVQDNPDA